MAVVIILSLIYSVCGTHTHTLTQTHTRTHRYTHTHAHRQTDRQTDRQTQTQTQTQTHTLPVIVRKKQKRSWEVVALTAVHSVHFHMEISEILNPKIYSHCIEECLKN